MKINSATFIGSYPKMEACPKSGLPEYAFIGRSNVGKSSLINALTDRKKLAKISGTPGKTQLINYFTINDSWYLVDLPGYGWAKVSKKMRDSFDEMIRTYISKREGLICTFVLVDIRHSPQKVDMEFMEWMGENQLPFYIVFTKADKLSAKGAENAVEKYKKEFLETWEEMPRHFITSAEKKIGVNEVLDAVEEINKSLK
ncbi:ribosome biogenesis GTP-binding protein YihA/YsxC [Flammeovirgaceae bacterium SG7u.111]|nr:ribosome biogenesis GTP-binding protein YihA/YsxC [Flammeovirgaceae bacterium SG7u.132]WPO35560.1 ribosome biogenesis GTP-binding protein YihA/YsxC [Flammeovirgaceae bacterium SG7u.111]